MPAYTIDITNHFSDSLVDQALLKEAIHRVLAEEGIASAVISLAIVSDAEIHRVNREFLGHDYPTDVISFLLNLTAPDATDADDADPRNDDLVPTSPDDSLAANFLEGELIVSRETAQREAVSHGWSLRAELLLYVVHGLLHLCGYDDLTDETRPLMRAREREILAIWEYCPTGLEM